MRKGRRLGVLGGTFDPIHVGHLDAADAAQHALRLTDVLLVPSSDPPHRPSDPHASVFHRFAMVALAIQGRDRWRTSDAEVLRPGLSYTVDTLRAIHADGWERLQIFFILGADAFAEIATWHEFPGVLDNAHFAVITRPGTTMEAALARTPALGSRVRTAPFEPDLRPTLSGSTGIFPVNARTRDVSSTTVRERLAARLPIDDLVTSAVARYIATNELYVPPFPSETVDDLHGQSSDSQHG
jgi:nicotinate-nucleotide adenylyltransferase